jgi:5-methyltetrahydropteroyltriglutamate--homocysteine methyltransferase
LRARHWKLQRDKGISVIPSNDFSFYDQMLDMTAALGAIPPRFLTDTSAQPTHPNGSARCVMEEAARGGGHIELDRTFAMARGTKDAPAMEMTKWFDTNYHYIVPEFHKDQTFKQASRKAVDEFNEAEGARHRHAAGAHRPCHLPDAWQGEGRGVRSGFPIGPAAPRLWRGVERPQVCRR